MKNTFLKYFSSLD